MGVRLRCASVVVLRPSLLRADRAEENRALLVQMQRAWGGRLADRTTGPRTAPAPRAASRPATPGAGEADASVTDALAVDADSEAGSEAGGNAVGHVIVVVQENHTFDAYFGRWCAAPAGSNPTCTSGPSCCEAAPTQDPSGALPVPLDDTENAVYSPNATKTCEVAEIDNGKMDAFVTDAGCADPRNWAIAPDTLVKPYHDLANQNAIADRYFQPIAGSSSSNDLYFAVAKEAFIDDAYEPNAVGSQCSANTNTTVYTGQTTIADLLQSAGKTITWYAEGFAAMQAARRSAAQQRRRPVLTPYRATLASSTRPTFRSSITPSSQATAEWSGTTPRLAGAFSTGGRSPTCPS